MLITPKYLSLIQTSLPNTRFYIVTCMSLTALLIFLPEFVMCELFLSHLMSTPSFHLLRAETLEYSCPFSLFHILYELLLAETSEHLSNSTAFHHLFCFHHARRYYDLSFKLPEASGRFPLLTHYQPHIDYCQIEARIILLIYMPDLVLFFFLKALRVEINSKQ